MDREKAMDLMRRAVRVLKANPERWCYGAFVGGKKGAVTYCLAGYAASLDLLPGFSVAEVNERGGEILEAIGVHRYDVSAWNAYSRGLPTALRAAAERGIR